MPSKRYSSEQIILKLKEAEVLLGKDQTVQRWDCRHLWLCGRVSDRQDMHPIGSDDRCQTCAFGRRDCSTKCGILK